MEIDCNEKLLKFFVKKLNIKMFATLLKWLPFFAFINCTFLEEIFDTEHLTRTVQIRLKLFKKKIFALCEFKGETWHLSYNRN